MAGRDRKSTRLNSSHANIYALSLHDALPICSAEPRGHGSGCPVGDSPRGIHERMDAVVSVRCEGLVCRGRGIFSGFLGFVQLLSYLIDVIACLRVWRDEIGRAHV